MQVLNEQTITIDLRRTVTIPVPRYRQYDTNILNIVVKDNKEDADLSNVSLITANYLRPDGEVVSRSLQKLGNVVEYQIKLEESQVFGEGELSIHFYEVDKRLSSKRIKIVMDESLEPNIEGTEDLTLLQELFQQVSTTLSDIQTSSQEITEAEALRVTAEETRAEAELLRQTAETNRKTVESERVSVELERKTAEQLRATAETERVDSENTRQTAETARIEAEEERQTNTTLAIQNAENATTAATEVTNEINLVLPNVLNLEYIAPYNATTQYLKNNIVRKDKNSYIALQDTVGNEPTGNTDSPFWGVIAIGGVDGTGTGTVTSVNGIEPVDGNVTIVIPDPDLSNYVTKKEIEVSPPIELAINRGIQVVTVPNGTPVNVLNLIGKTIINYAPLFDSGLWTKHANAVINSPNKITLTASAVDSSSLVTIPVKPNTTYTVSFKGNGKVSIHQKTGATFVSGSGYQGNLYTFTTATNIDNISLILTNDVATGTFTFEDVMLNEGSTAKEFVANIKGVINPTIINTTTDDSLTVVGTFHDGDIVNPKIGQVTRAKKEIVLDGRLLGTDPQAFSYAGNKRIYLGELARILGKTKVVKYNGKIMLPTTFTANMPSDSFAEDVSTIYITIPNADSGWGETYTPTADEIKAYFMGWRMFDNSVPAVNGVPVIYNGTGVKAWHLWGDDGKYGGIISTLPKTQVPINSKWQPYRLIYDLATPQTESIKIIGSLMLASGENNVSVTEGRIVRERVTPVGGKAEYGYYRMINFFDGAVDSRLRNKAVSFIGIYKNGKLDPVWKYNPVGTANYQNGYMEHSRPSDYDQTAIYEAAYIPLEPYKVSAYANPISIEYRDNLGGVVEELVEDTRNLASRVCSNESLLNAIIPMATQETIVESAKNANGSYVKFADGTLICTLIKIAPVSATITYGSSFISDLITWNFPHVFASEPSVSIDTNGSWSIINSLGGVWVTFKLVTAVSNPSVAYYTTIAIGRWK